MSVSVSASVATATDTATHQTRDQLSLHLEELVVTGTRTAQSLIDNPVRVEMIPQEAIERQHALDLADAVQTIPGLSLRSIRGKEGSEAWMQGISANRVLVLVDGEPVSASTGSTVDLSQVSTAAVSRIEVVKGATSVLYGSAAMGGVINVITADVDPGLQANFSADAGSYGAQNPSGNDIEPARKRVNAHGSYRSENWTTTLGVNARYSEGYAIDPDAWDQQGADGHKINARASLRFHPSENSYYQISHEDYQQAQHTRFTETLANNRFQRNKTDDAERQHTAIKGFWAYANGDINLQAYNEDYTNDSKPKDTLRRVADFDSQKVAGQWNGYVSETQTLTLGADFFKEQLQQYKQDNGEAIEHELQGNEAVSRDSIELYIQDDISFNQLTLLPGIRWQKDSDFGEKFTPKINARWDFDNTYIAEKDWDLFLRAGVGKGYRVPNLKERYYIFDHSHLGYIVEGNPDLQPESSLSYQLGLVLANRDFYQADINLFRNELSDLIETTYARTDGTVQVYQYNNIDAALTQGVELNSQFKLLDNLRVQGGYVYLQAIDEQSERRLKDRPRHQIKAVIDYTTDFDLGISFIAQWQDEEVDESRQLSSPQWSKFDLKLNQALGHKGFSLYGGINNITNQQRDFYATYDNRPVEPRLLYLGFKLTH